MIKLIFIRYLFLFTFTLTITLVSCNDSKYECSINTPEQTTIFPKGQKVTNEHFTGKVWLNYLVPADSIYQTSIGSVTFEPGARTHWHYHQGGQILLVTDGEGLYQEKGKQIQIIKKGETIKCPPNMEHWHGATSKKSMTHIAIGPNSYTAKVIWLEPVKDTEYNY
ncbi:cupin domain-containing protein [Apibacter sp. HY039]|uniref:(R)-mandelonitrile lyase n=1 Tax=Apibacter sp. HY039 TaxID=2501476 RepID=UPI000FEC0953|nr:cupin domain-containing protein [Apibacter sp. HY039]